MFCHLDLDFDVVRSYPVHSTVWSRGTNMRVKLARQWRECWGDSRELPRVTIREKNRSGSTESLYWREFSQARQKIYLTSVKSPSHQTVKVFLLKSKLEPKVDALCCWTQTFHGISGIVLSPMAQRKNCILTKFTIYDLFYTGVLSFCGNFSICFSFWHVIIIKGWHPLDIGGYPIIQPSDGV